jgi:hypothetical protein
MQSNGAANDIGCLLIWSDKSERIRNTASYWKFLSLYPDIFNNIFSYRCLVTNLRRQMYGFVTHESWIKWVMGREFNGSVLRDTSSTLIWILSTHDGQTLVFPSGNLFERMLNNTSTYSFLGLIQTRLAFSTSLYHPNIMKSSSVYHHQLSGSPVFSLMSFNIGRDCARNILVRK